MALPPASVRVPKLVAASIKVTLPVGEAPVIVAVNVTLWPPVDGFGLELRVAAAEYLPTA